MTTIAEIQAAVRALPEEDFGAFSSWFEQYEQERWDRAIEKDSAAGKLDFLLQEARDARNAGVQPSEKP